MMYDEHCGTPELLGDISMAIPRGLQGSPLAAWRLFFLGHTWADWLYVCSLHCICQRQIGCTPSLTLVQAIARLQATESATMEARDWQIR